MTEKIVTFCNIIIFWKILVCCCFCVCIPFKVLCRLSKNFFQRCFITRGHLESDSSNFILIFCYLHKEISYVILTSEYRNEICKLEIR